ncbi:MAG: protein phosphatase 2C domain-containing protein [Pseudomonadota bacterium]
MRVVFYGASDRGRVRKMNQDSIIFSEKLGYGVVADGIGGRPGGDKASEIVTRTISRVMAEPHEIRYGEVTAYMTSLVDKVNREVKQFGTDNPQWHGLGSTMEFLFFSGGELFLAHVGDSRTYMVSGGDIFLITVDHNVATFQQRGLVKHRLNSGVSGSALTRAVGLLPTVDVDVYSKKLVGGEIFVTASDGLFDMISDSKILQIVVDAKGQLEGVSEKLIAEANKNGGRDNITVLLSQVFP